MPPVAVQVKGEAHAVMDALKQLSALLRTQSQRKPQQVTNLYPYPSADSKPAREAVLLLH